MRQRSDLWVKAGKIVSIGLFLLLIGGLFLSACESWQTDPADTFPDESTEQNDETTETVIPTTQAETSQDIEITTEAEIHDPAIADISIVLLKSISPITVTQNQPVNLPSAVSALMSNGSTQNVSVTWSNTIDTCTFNFKYTQG